MLNDPVPVLHSYRQKSHKELKERQKENNNIFFGGGNLLNAIKTALNRLLINDC